MERDENQNEITTLRARLAACEASNELLLGQVAAQDELLQRRAAEIETLRLELLLKDHHIHRLRHALYGDRSERMKPIEPTLPGLDLGPANDPPAPAPVERNRVRPHDRKKPRKARARLELDPSCVTEKNEVVDCEEIHCAICGRERPVIGNVTRVRVDRVPAKYIRTTTMRLKRACSICKNGVGIAPAQDLPTGNGIVGPTLAIDIVLMHFFFHMPFHRIAAMLKCEGVSTCRATLSRVSMRVARALCVIVRAMETDLIAQNGAVGIDGTTLKIFAKNRCQRRMMYVTHGAGHVVYRVLPHENAHAILDRFKGFTGPLECDAATVHTGTVSVSFGLRLALCNAHARRKFKEARDTDRARADHALRFFQRVSRWEQQWKHLTPEDRQRERQTIARPLYEEFKEWLLRERVSLGPRAPMTGAFDYMLSHWEGLTLFLTDGRASWTNNTSERLLRHVVLGRKAWIFRGTLEGAELACVLWSLMMSCRLHNVDPRKYLLDTIAALDTCRIDDVLSLTPREYAKRQSALAVAA